MTARATESLVEMFDRLSVPSFIRDEMSQSIRARCVLAWDEGYGRGVRDELGDVEPADNPYRDLPSLVYIENSDDECQHCGSTLQEGVCPWC